MRVIVINGPNLNMLGVREKNFYGEKSLDEINEELLDLAKSFSMEIEFYQSNHEGEIVDKIQNCYGKKDYILINPGAYTHTSVAIRDALLSVDIPTVEIHLSNPYKRECFRHKSLIEDIVVGKIVGFGSTGYKMGLFYLNELRGAKR